MDGKIVSKPGRWICAWVRRSQAVNGQADFCEVVDEQEGIAFLDCLMQGTRPIVLYGWVALYEPVSGLVLHSVWGTDSTSVETAFQKWTSRDGVLQELLKSFAKIA